MKPVFQTGRPARDGELFAAPEDKSHKTPVTDWSFQASAPTFGGGGAGFSGKERASFRAFRALGNSFFNAEARRDEQVEAGIFGVFVALAAGPMAMAAQAAFHLIK